MLLRLNISPKENLHDAIGIDLVVSLLGIIFMIVGALIVILSLLNYLQDRRISLTIVFGLLSIALGALFYSRAKSRTR